MNRTLILLFLTISTALFGQERHLIGKELGVLEAKIETYKENIVIYNQDGSVWMQFDFDYENKVKNKYNYTFDDIKKLYNWNNDFNPYVFNIDNTLLMFICTGIEEDRYKIVVNKETGLEKYIQKEDFWILRSWEDHIVHSVVSIDFDTKANPLRSKPTKDSEKIKLGENIDPVIVPIEIKDDWLKIKYWENDIEKTGWIIWNLNNQIIVNLYYLI